MKESNIADDSNGIDLVLENYSQEMIEGVKEDCNKRKNDSSLLKLISSVIAALRKEDLKFTRLVVTGDIIASVNSREDRTSKAFTLDRGSGMVAAKTMPKNDDGLVDILIPFHWVLPLEGQNNDRDDYLDHLAVHEAIHATIFHIGDEPFDLHHREEFECAMKNFVSMASEQAEEHLAEYIGSTVTNFKTFQTKDEIKSAIEAWQETISKKLPEISNDDPDYFHKGMIVSFEALHILWKSLACLASGLREENKFKKTPSDITNLPSWIKFIQPWWTKYLDLLGQIPMTTEVDIAHTDEVIRKLALHLQEWSHDIGFDFHDSEHGPYFQMTASWLAPYSS